MKKFTSLICFGLVALACVCNAQSAVLIKNGFYTGNLYTQATEVERQHYLLGLVDGFFFSPAFSAPKAAILPFETCVSAMTSPQILAIADRYVSQHPEKWDLSMHIIFHSAMVEACTSRGIDLLPK